MAVILALLTPTSVWVSQDVRIASVLNAGLVGMFLVPGSTGLLRGARQPECRHRCGSWWS